MFDIVENSLISVEGCTLYIKEVQIQSPNGMHQFNGSLVCSEVSSQVEYTGTIMVYTSILDWAASTCM